LDTSTGKLTALPSAATLAKLRGFAKKRDTDEMLPETNNFLSENAQ
jgi:hypothetical protein